MIKHDFHVHTSFSSDCSASMESMIERGIELGLDSICFTEHYDYDFPPNPENLDFLLDFEKYQKQCLLYKEKYQDRIEILQGIEIGIQEHLGKKLEDFYYLYGKDYDFILASCHVAANMDPYEAIYFDSYPGEKGMQLYFETLLHNMDVYHHYQSCAHLDYAYRYYPKPRPDFSYSKYADLLDEILKKIIQGGKALEINTSGLRSGLPFANPHKDILLRYRELGGNLITIGSDAHKPVDLGYHFLPIKDYLLCLGFQYYTIYRKQKAYHIKL